MELALILGGVVSGFVPWIIVLVIDKIVRSGRAEG